MAGKWRRRLRVRRLATSCHSLHATADRRREKEKGLPIPSDSPFWGLLIAIKEQAKIRREKVERLVLAFFIIALLLITPHLPRVVLSINHSVSIHGFYLVFLLLKTIVFNRKP